MPAQLAQAMIFAKDLPRMREFYTSFLGSAPTNTEWTESYAEFGGAGFALHAIPAEIARGIQVTTPAQPRETSAVKVTFRVESVEAERARLIALGAQILNRPWGGWDAADPEGNVFAVTTG